MSDSPRPTLTTEALIAWWEAEAAKWHKAAEGKHLPTPSDWADTQSLRNAQLTPYREMVARFDTIAALLRQGEQSRQDAARLDALEAMKADLCRRGGRWRVDDFDEELLEYRAPFWGDTVRDAIDASRSQPFPPTQEAG
jgi:hypothetical protein